MDDNDRQANAVLNLVILATIAIVGVICSRRRRTVSTTAFGTARWAYDRLLRNWGMLGRHGLVLGRTLGGALIRVPRFCHVLLVGGTGSGKGVGLIIPNLLDYERGSVVVFDPKGDLYRTTAARRRARGERVILLAPTVDGADTWNMLDAIPNDAMVFDNARATVEALVVRPAGGSHEPHWDDKAVQIITAVLVFVLTRLPAPERNLNSLKDILSDPQLLAAVGDKLKEMGGIAARMGNDIHALFE